MASLNHRHNTFFIRNTFTKPSTFICTFSNCSGLEFDWENQSNQINTFFEFCNNTNKTLGLESKNLLTQSLIFWLYMHMTYNSKTIVPAAIKYWIRSFRDARFEPKKQKITIINEPVNKLTKVATENMSLNWFISLWEK